MDEQSPAPLQPFDSAGNTVVAGAQAVIVSIPAWLTHDLPAEEATALKLLQGTARRIVEVDEFGYVWFGSGDGSPWFCVRPSDTLVCVGSGEPPD